MAVVKRGRRRKKVTKKNKVQLSLPTERSEPSGNLFDYSMLFFGEKKIGKTSMCSFMPDTFFMMCEPGGKALRIYQKPVRNWTEFKGYVDLLEKSTRFRTVVIDTVDLAYKMCSRWVCRKAGVTHPHEADDYGKTWNAVADEFAMTLQRLLNMDKGCVFISHSKESTITRRSGKQHDKIQSTLADHGRAVLDPMVDIWCYYTYDGDDRVLQIEGNDLVSCGHRLEEHFVGVAEIHMGTSPKQSYENFVAAFNNKPLPHQKPKGGATKRTVRKKVSRKHKTGSR